MFFSIIFGNLNGVWILDQLYVHDYLFDSIRRLKNMGFFMPALCHLNFLFESCSFPYISKGAKAFWKLTTSSLQVNRIRELPQNGNIVATHTDSPDVSKIQWDISYMSEFKNTRAIFSTFACFYHLGYLAGYIIWLSKFDSATRSWFGMWKVNRTVMLYWGLLIRVQIW